MKINRYFEWLNEDSVTRKEKYFKRTCVTVMLLIPILLVGYMDDPVDYRAY